MQEIGVDISGNKTKAVFDMFKSGKMFTYVITVCDETSAERCPIVPDVTRRFHWGFPDPSSFQGTHEEKLAKTREVRDMIKAKTEEHQVFWKPIRQPARNERKARIEHVVQHIENDGARVSVGLNRDAESAPFPPEGCALILRHWLSHHALSSGTHQQPSGGVALLHPSAGLD